MTLNLQDEHRIAIELALRASQRIEAVVLVRRYAGVGLREAVDYINELERKLGPSPAQDKYDHSWAWVVAIGCFRSDLIEYLWYPAEMYENTQNGAVIVTGLFEANGRREVEALARSFQIDPWDFNQHKLVPGNLCEDVIWDELYDNPTVADLTPYWEAYNKEMQRFTALRDANFDFYFWMRDTAWGDEH